ncbi:MAG: hypothetical protein PHP25_04455 [Candidatus Moranbacteria bacterium]|nr:hypothetical protein [Candidatus Moranbacteria bacterium]
MEKSKIKNLRQRRISLWLKKSKFRNRCAIKYFKKGFSILEVVAAVFIFSVVTVTMYSSFSAGLKSVAQSKHRVAATELANEKMEIIRNLPYNQVGTEGGVPSGSLLQNETVVRSNQKFDVRTTIIYVDDPLDGVAGGSPDDTVSRDYKEARVEVTWSGIAQGHGVILVSRFVPDGVENESGGGTFVLNVIDSTGQGISEADAHIVNNAVTPHIDITTQTDSTGSILMAGMPASSQKYEISVSKSAYETVSTMAPYPGTAYEPTDVHGSVDEGTLNSKSIILDKVGTINIVSEDLNGNLIPNMHFHIQGGRILGMTKDVPQQTVYSCEQDLSTGLDSTKQLENMSPGNYVVNFTESGYTLVGTEAPLLPFSLAPGQDLSVSLLIVNNLLNSLIVNVKNSATTEMIKGASVHIYNGTDFDQTLMTGDSGRVYFPPNLDPPVVMTGGLYNIEISAPGYGSYSGTVTIDKLVQTTIPLTLLPQT